MSSWPERATRNNAQWCAVACTLQGISTEFSEDAWTSSRRTPLLFPDAVALVPSLSVPGLLSRIDTSAGCSVKDSFATLDLEAFGFEVLFDARWIVRSPGGAQEIASSGTWSVVGDEVTLDVWNRAWSSAQRTKAHFPPPILVRDDIVMAARFEGGNISAGAILNNHAGAVGITNLFTSSGGATDTWAGCLGFIGTLFPGVPTVGYETGGQLAAAQACGFETVGPLRIWVRT